MKKTIIAIVLISSISGCNSIGDGSIVSDISFLHSRNGTDMCHYSSNNWDGYITAPCSLYRVGDTIHIK